MENKTCSSCKITKPLTNFHKDSRSRDGRMYACKACRCQPKEKFVSHPESGKLCWKCKKLKPICEFGIDNSRYDKLNPRCKPCSRTALKDSTKRHPETSARKWKKRYAKDKENILKRNKMRQLERIKNQSYLERSEKSCRVCKEVKSISDFTKHARSADGYKSECSKCRAEYRKTAHYKHLQRVAKHKRRAREFNAEGSYKTVDIRNLFRIQNGCCVYCLIELNEDFHVDHITPLARGGTNWSWNLQLLCPLCNMRKNAKTPEEFLSIYPLEVLRMQHKKSGC